MRQKKGFTPTAVVLGRNAVTDRWFVAWASPWYRTSRDQFRRDLNRVKLVDECTHWCIVWGCADERPRDVITI